MRVRANSIVIHANCDRFSLHRSFISLQHPSILKIANYNELLLCIRRWWRYVVIGTRNLFSTTTTTEPVATEVIFLLGCFVVSRWYFLDNELSGHLQQIYSNSIARSIHQSVSQESHYNRRRLGDIQIDCRNDMNYHTYL